jgi:cyanate permease
MQCPQCVREFKNHNSYRVHKWRFHNPNTKYRSARTTGTYSSSTIPSDPRYAIPAAATVGLLASGGGWKKWLILILVLLGLAVLVWYLVTKQSEDEE